MLICKTVAEVKNAVAGLRKAGTVGLVTTMGALHAGHMALVAAAARDHASVVATIFVNPTQFGDAKDLENYPRTEAADLAMLEAAGVAAVFMPTPDVMYPAGDETIVETTHLANILHGAVRPGHFRGVATVVTKLLNIVGPDAAYFGEKDYQQLAVIRRVVADLFIPVAIHGVPTVREADGLAMSSRNVRLIGDERYDARVLNLSLTVAAAMVKEGATIEVIAETIRGVIASKRGATLAGLDIVDAETFAPVTGVPTRKIGIMIAVQFMTVLLIDQKEITP
ncbi:pantoate--beta-alanine ligase [Loktanella salsilacus]|uniref:pantoate--beta-alanine ligase n=1 Tax=Loktanella salsilacus TaxID=195913 RepID=UPI0037047062